MEGESADGNDDWVKRTKNGRTEYFYDPDVKGKDETETKYGEGSHMEDGSSIVGRTSDGEEVYRYTFHDDGTYSRNGNVVNERTHTALGSVIYQFCPSCLDPRTLYRQFGGIGGLTYSGPTNPKNYLGEDDYSYGFAEGMSFVDLGGKLHDKDYAYLGIKGADGLFTSRRAISADWRFVYGNISLIGAPGISIKESFKAGILGFGLGTASLPKTLLNFVLPSPIYNYPYTPKQKALIHQGMSNFK